jgi:hypothetical protein
MLICFVILIILICILGYKVYKIDKEIKIMKADMKKFQKAEATKREIGWDSIWKIVNQR